MEMERQQAENVKGGKELPLEILYGADWVDVALEGKVTEFGKE
jgi:hypothetical protein